MEQRLLIADHNAELCEHDHSDQSGVTTIVQFAAPLTRPTREYSSSEIALPLRLSHCPRRAWKTNTSPNESNAPCVRPASGRCALFGLQSAQRVVILGGRVSSHYLKQVAQSTAQAVPGAHQIRNDLHVFKPKWDRHDT